MEKFIMIEIDGVEGKFDFECYPNTETINVGDKFLFFFAGIADVQTCSSEVEMFEINPNDKEPDPNTIDFVAGFWKKCYKIKETNFDLSTV
jgi:hypothetical protein